MSPAVGDAIECPSCEAVIDLADLERHLRGSHGFPRSTAARVAAEERASGARRDAPEPPDTRNRVTSQPEPGSLASVAARQPRAGKPHRADPASCLTCARLSAKCRRHGGRIRSTSYRGMGEAGAFAVAVKAYKRQLVEDALRQTGGHRTAAAKLLGVRIAYLFRLLRNLGLLDAASNAVAERVGDGTNGGGA